MSSITKIHLKSNNIIIPDVISQIRKYAESHSEFSLIITGPTGSGKTNLAHQIFDLIPSMLINADSRQIYTEINIGSNKPHLTSHLVVDCNNTAVAEEKYIYWNMDILKLSEIYSAQDYRTDVRKMIFSLYDKKILPIIVGGSMHWISSLMSESISPFYISDYEKYLQLCEKSLEELQKIYREIYPSNKINDSDWQNSRRLSRAIEYFQITNRSVYDDTIHEKNIINFLIIELQIDRVEHKEKIRNSVTERINKGWIEEVKNALEKYPDSNIVNKLGQGFRIIAESDFNNINKEYLIEKITNAEMIYAKKQIL